MEQDASRNQTSPTQSTTEAHRASGTANTAPYETEPTTVPESKPKTIDGRDRNGGGNVASFERDAVVKDASKGDEGLDRAKDDSVGGRSEGSTLDGSTEELEEDIPVIGRIDGFVSDVAPVLHPLAHQLVQDASRANAGEGEEEGGLRQRSWGVTADYSMRTPNFYVSHGGEWLHSSEVLQRNVCNRFALVKGQEQMLVIDGVDEQFIITSKEQSGGDGAVLELKVKRSSTSGVVFVLLKLLYLYVTVFFCGFWIVFSVFLILQFVMGVVVTGRCSWKSSLDCDELTDRTFSFHD